MINKDCPRLLTILLLAIAAITCFCLPPSALADGMVMRFDPYANRWDYSDETAQNAFINYENGREKMIISIKVDANNYDDSVWIFPIPANPRQININAIPNLPSFEGEDIAVNARANMDEAKKFMLWSQIYPLFNPFGSDADKSLTRSSNALMPAAGTFGMSSSSVEPEPDVIAYSHLDKEGIVSEVVSAKSATSLQEYFAGKNLHLADNALPIINQYIGQDYSFVVSWLSTKTNKTDRQIVMENLNYYINDLFQMENYKKLHEQIRSLELKYPQYPRYSGALAKFLQTDANIYDVDKLIDTILEYIYKDENPAYWLRDRQKPVSEKGVFVDFPTQQLYFPLLPTSVYGEKIVPATVRILGHVNPQVFSAIKEYTTVKYYENDYPFVSPDFAYFVNQPQTKTVYTKISIDAPSKQFTQDLWVEQAAPLKSSYLMLFASSSINPVVRGIIIHIICSMVTGFIVGFILFPYLRRKPHILVLLGLSNILSIIGVIFITPYIATRKPEAEAEIILQKIKTKGYFGKRKLAFAALRIWILSLVFIASNIFISLVNDLLFSPIAELINDFIYRLREYLTYSVGSYHILVSLILLAFFFIFRREKKEDEYLFDRLESLGCSARTLCPKDVRKILYIPFYSAVFVTLTMLFHKLLLYTFKIW